MTLALAFNAPAAPTLRPYQLAALEAIEARFAAGDRGTLLVLATGCHRAGQLVLMHDGSARAVEDVRVGDELIGPDGQPRRVLQLVRGQDAMFEIQPTKGEPWVVNGDHVLTLVRTSSGSTYPSQRGGVLVDVTVREWMTWSATRRHLHKLVRVGVDFPEQGRLRIAPYFLGVLLGDGSLIRSVTVTAEDREIWDACRPETERWGLSFVPLTPDDRCHGFRVSSSSKGPGTNAMLAELDLLGLRVDAGAKHVPAIYQRAPRADRLELLAGLIDTDGNLQDGGAGFELTSKSRALADDVAFVARSLGFAAHVRPKEVRYRYTRHGHEPTDEMRTYFRVHISGDVSVVPCRVPRKQAAARRQKKDVLRTGFTIAPTGTREEYFGFTLDGDHRYLLGDFTVTHNCGKTVVFSELARRRVTAGHRALVLAHRTELLEQACAKLEATGVDAAIEQGPRQAGRASVVVASVQTLRGARLQRWAPDAFDLVIIDEAHHATASTYRAIVDHFGPARVLGVTATPDRADGEGLGTLFASIAYRYEIGEGIRDGYLAPIRARRVKLDVDLDQVKTRAGDLDQVGLSKVMTDPDVLEATARALMDQVGDRPTVLFTVDVAHAHLLAEACNLIRSGAARAVSGESSAEERTAAARDLAERRVQIVANAALWTEGFDCPIVGCVAIAKPTKSRSLFAQCVGRGTRLAPGKADCLVLDFAGLTSRHKLVSTIDVLAGDGLPEEIRDLAVERTESEPTDLEAAIAEARAQLERARRAPTMRWIAEEVTDLLGVDVDARLLGEGFSPAQPWQLQQLADKGFKPPAGLTELAATKVLTVLNEREARRLCSYKQIKFLLALCIPRSLAKTLTKREAGLAIAELKPILDRGRSFRTLLQSHAVDVVARIERERTQGSAR